MKTLPVGNAENDLDFVESDKNADDFAATGAAGASGVAAVHSGGLEKFSAAKTVTDLSTKLAST